MKNACKIFLSYRRAYILVDVFLNWAYFSTKFQDINRFFLADTPQKVDNIYLAAHWDEISFSPKLSCVVFWYAWTSFLVHSVIDSLATPWNEVDSTSVLYFALRFLWDVIAYIIVSIWIYMLENFRNLQVLWKQVLVLAIQSARVIFHHGSCSHVLGNNKFTRIMFAEKHSPILREITLNFKESTKFPSRIKTIVSRQGSTLRPVGSPIRPAFTQWRLNFHACSPTWPPR